jgi:hypothetical protein
MKTINLKTVKPKLKKTIYIKKNITHIAWKGIAKFNGKTYY